MKKYLIIFWIVIITAAFGAYITYDRNDVKYKSVRARDQWILFGGAIGVAVGVVPAILVANALTKK